MYSMRLWECFSITDSIHIKGLTCGKSGDGTHIWLFYKAPLHRGDGPRAKARSPRCELDTLLPGPLEESTLHWVRPGRRHGLCENAENITGHTGGVPRQELWGPQAGAVVSKRPGPSQSLGLQTQGH